MLDQVLNAQAALNAMRFLTAVALLASGLIVVGFAGLAITRRFAPGRFATGARLASRVVLGLGTIGIAGLILLLVVSRFWPLPRYEWTIDLRNEAPLQPFMQDGCARWAIGARTYLDCIYEGRVTLAAQFPRNLSVNRTGRALWASGRDNRLVSLHLFLETMSISEAQATIEALIEPWGLRRDFYDSWREPNRDRRRPARGLLHAARTRARPPVARSLGAAPRAAPGGRPHLGSRSQVALDRRLLIPATRNLPPYSESRFTVSIENAGRHTAMYSAPLSGVL